MFGKRNKYSFNGDGNLDCEFLTSTFNDGYSYSVGLVNHFKKEVSPCHGYCYPNRYAKSLMNYALNLVISMWIVKCLLLRIIHY